MDFHVEQLVAQKKGTADYLFAALLCLVTAAVWVLIFTFLGRLGLLCAILIVLSGYGSFYLLQSLNTEYEYELTNYCLDIDKISGKARRKRLTEIDLHDVTLCTYVTASEFSDNGDIQKTFDFSGNPSSSDRIFIDCLPDGGKKTRVILLANEKLKDCIKKAVPKVTRL